jgi:hypothetical protein
VEGWRRIWRHGQRDDLRSWKQQRRGEHPVVRADQESSVARHGDRVTCRPDTGVDHHQMNGAGRETPPVARYCQPCRIDVVRDDVMRNVLDPGREVTNMPFSSAT